MTDKEDKTVRQFVLFCRKALTYEKKNYYNERKNRAERETHMEMLSLKQSGMVEKIFDTYHADYFSVMGYEIGIIDGDLAQALRELPDKKIQIVLLYYFAGLSDREIGEIYGTGRSTICDQRNNAMQEVIRLFKPYMTRLSIEDGRFNNELFERLVQRLMFITWQFDMHYSEK